MNYLREEYLTLAYVPHRLMEKGTWPCFRLFPDMSMDEWTGVIMSTTHQGIPLYAYPGSAKSVIFGNEMAFFNPKQSVNILAVNHIPPKTMKGFFVKSKILLYENLEDFMQQERKSRFDGVNYPDEWLIQKKYPNG